MLDRKRPLPTYSDGWVELCRERPGLYTGFRAKQNVSSRDDLVPVCRLAFAEASRRQQDLDFAESKSFTLSMKIRTRRIDGVDPDCKAVIGDTLFDICWVDPSRTELYLYLQEAGTLCDPAFADEGSGDDPR